MTTALAVAQETVRRAAQPYVRGGKSYCQSFAGNFWETFFGRPTPNSYATARAAQLASGWLNPDYNAAPPGAYHYFTYGSAGHVGVSLGSGLMASGTGWGTNAVANLGKNVLVHRVADYAAHLPYLGWSLTNGARAQITGLTDANAPAVAANQRKVASNKTARLRQRIPSTLSAYDPNANLKANGIYTPDGFVRSGYEGGVANGSNVWFKFGDNYAHCSGFTDTGVAGLADLGTLAPPKPVVVHTVTVMYLNVTGDVKTIPIEDGNLLPAPTAPERDLFDFKGWAVNGELFDFATPIRSDLTIAALWEQRVIEPTDPLPEPGEPVDPGPVDPELPEVPPVEPEPEVPVDPIPVPPKPGKGIFALIGAAVVVILAAIAAVLSGGGQ